MRICTVTCHGYHNHGAALQAYALTQWLAALGHEVEMIDYRPPYLQVHTRLWYMPKGIKDAGRLLLQYNYRKDTLRRHRAHLRFAAAHLPLSPRTYSGVADLRENFPGADVLVAGSDQIWNTDFPNGSDETFYLRFGTPGTHRISYAASFAIPELPEQKRPAVGAWIKGLDAVSVRESSALGILATLGCTGTQVCDPVFLHPADFWLRLDDGSGSRGGYLLVYDFYSDAAMRRVAEKLARLRGLKIVSAGNVRLGYAHRNCCGCGPETFLSLVAHADCVLSNSFHATAFSLVFHKDFYVVDRPDGLNRRMHDITSRYGLAHRIVAPGCPESALLAPVDYNKVQPLLDADIEASRAWLSKAISRR